MLMKALQQVFWVFFSDFFGINDWQCYKCVQFEVKSKRMFHAMMNSTKATKTKL